MHALQLTTGRAMRILSIKNYDAYQHYKDRRPPWIKMHASVLDDYAFCCLQDASKAHLMLLWLLASKLDNRIPWDEQWLAKQLSATGPVNIQPLVDTGFVLVTHDASEALATCKQSAMPETEAETEKKTTTTTTLVVLQKPQNDVKVKAGTRYADVRTRIEGYFANLTEVTRTKSAQRSAQIDIAFAYWVAKYDKPRALLDKKRESRIGERLKENGGDLSELLYALDGGLRDKHLTEGGYDMLETVLRDRGNVERLAQQMPKYRAGDMHPMAKKLLAESDDGVALPPPLELAAAVGA